MEEEVRLGIVGNHQVRPSIEIEIERHNPQCLTPGILDAGHGGHVPEMSVTFVMVIANGNAHAIHLHIEADCFRHVLKSAMMVVFVKLERRMTRNSALPIVAIHEDNINPSVIVEVEEGAA